VVSYFLRYFSSTSTEQISPIPPDLSPVSIRLALLFLLLFQRAIAAQWQASSFESLHSPRQHLPNSVYHVRRSSFSRSVDRAGEHTAGEARLRYDVVFVHRAQGVMAE